MHKEKENLKLYRKKQKTKKKKQQQKKKKKKKKKTNMSLCTKGKKVVCCEGKMLLFPNQHSNNKGDNMMSEMSSTFAISQDFGCIELHYWDFSQATWAMIYR